MSIETPEQIAGRLARGAMLRDALVEAIRADREQIAAALLAEADRRSRLPSGSTHIGEDAVALREFARRLGRGTP